MTALLLMRQRHPIRDFPRCSYPGHDFIVILAMAAPTSLAGLLHDTVNRGSRNLTERSDRNVRFVFISSLSYVTHVLLCFDLLLISS